MIITQLRLVQPFPRERTAAYTTLRQVTRDDITSWLFDRPNRVHEASALRSLFGVLKKERLVFANPMRGVRTSGNHVSVPIPLTSQKVDAVATAAEQDPALRVVVALAGVHALPARRIRALQLDQVDRPGRRLDPADSNRPLDDYTAEAITNYLAHRRRRWPNSTNPHLLVSGNTRPPPRQRSAPSGSTAWSIGSPSAWTGSDRTESSKKPPPPEPTRSPSPTSSPSAPRPASATPPQSHSPSRNRPDASPGQPPGRPVGR
ncbi:hypothetical protein SGLAM104S_02785 [Streptomyces glaucescens]